MCLGFTSYHQTLLDSLSNVQWNASVALLWMPAFVFIRCHPFYLRRLTMNWVWRSEKSLSYIWLYIGHCLDTIIPCVEKDNAFLLLHNLLAYEHNIFTSTKGKYYGNLANGKHVDAFRNLFTYQMTHKELKLNKK